MCIGNPGTSTVIWEMEREESPRRAQASEPGVFSTAETIRESLLQQGSRTESYPQISTRIVVHMCPPPLLLTAAATNDLNPKIFSWLSYVKEGISTLERSRHQQRYNITIH